MVAGDRRRWARGGGVKIKLLAWVGIFVIGFFFWYGVIEIISELT